MASLAEIFTRHGTDKRPGYHDYAAVYGPLLAPLREQPITLLEIGVSAGRSLRAWADYFPRARIYALDREPKREHDTARIRTTVANQADRASLHAALALLGSPALDLVIDDGGHRMDEQQVSLGTLFPNVRPDGLYVIEDVHTSFPDLYPGYGVDADGGNSTYALLDTFARTGRIASRYLTDPEAADLERSIASCAYHLRAGRRHSHMAVLRKTR